MFPYDNFMSFIKSVPFLFLLNGITYCYEKFHIHFFVVTNLMLRNQSKPSLFFGKPKKNLFMTNSLTITSDVIVKLSLINKHNPNGEKNF